MPAIATPSVGTVSDCRLAAKASVHHRSCANSLSGAALDRHQRASTSLKLTGPLWGCGAWLAGPSSVKA
eukprot:4319798-Lingulodinium_polyedra.AAC.1